MQMTMTERDKKLIVMLSIVVIVVAIGWWGIRPALNAAKEAREEIAEEEELKATNDMKIARIPILEEKVESNHQKLDELKKDYFPMMNSEQIDKKFTGLVLKRGLFSYDLGIQIDPTPLLLSPYRYSRMATDPYYYGTADEEEELDFSEDETEDGFSEEELEEESSTVNDNVYRAHVHMRIGGGKDELLRLIDDLAEYEYMLLITGYRWSESTYVEPYELKTEDDDAKAEDTEAEPEEELPEGAHVEEDAEGAYLVVVRQVLELDLDIYMYNDTQADTESTY